MELAGGNVQKDRRPIADPEPGQDVPARQQEEEDPPALGLELAPDVLDKDLALEHLRVEHGIGGFGHDGSSF
ncbi:hypothetical protein D3C87_2085790 [compost metagenome]